MRLLWLFLGLAATGAGLLGLFLPLVPTVPFLLLAAFCFARSSDRLHHWLMSHPHLGPLIDDWHQHRAIRPAAKRAASLSVAAVFVLSLLLGLPGWVLAFQGIVLVAVLLFIWTRADGRS